MNRFSEILSTDLTTTNFCFSTMTFLLLYVVGFIALRKWGPIAERTSAIHRHFISGFGAALVAAALGFGLHAANVTMASAKGQSEATISPQQIHRSMEMKTMQVQEIDDQTFVFPKH
jgi:uncharacterized membrane protein